MIHEPEQHTRATLPDDREPEPLIEPYPGEAIKLDAVKPQAVLPAAPDRPRRSRMPLLIAGLALVLFAAVGAGFWWGAYDASQKMPILGPVSVQVPKVPTQAPLGDGLFRPHYFTSIGDGPLSHVSYSDGLAPISDAEMPQYEQRQRIAIIDHPNGCDTAGFNSSKLWVSTIAPATLYINDTPIANFVHDTGSHGYMFDWVVNIGDKICLLNPTTGVAPSIFYVFFGKDIYYDYDSYCYRRNCEWAPPQQLAFKHLHSKEIHGRVHRSSCRAG